MSAKGNNYVTLKLEGNYFFIARFTVIGMRGYSLSHIMTKLPSGMHPQQRLNPDWASANMSNYHKNTQQTDQDRQVLRLI